MSKSRSAVGSNPTRRMSQPAQFGSGGGPDRGRRVSDVSGSRGTDPPAPPGAGSVTAHYEDKMGADKGARKARVAKDGGPEAVSFDPDHYNPDGSLRAVHRMPKFSDAYAEASKARYIRRNSPTDTEKELSVREVFGTS